MLFHRIAGRGLIAAVAIMAMALLDGAAPARAQQRDLRISETSCLCDASAAVARELGYLDEELRPLNVKVAYSRFETGPAAGAALQAGGLDIAMFGAASVAMIANGLPVRYIMVGDDPSTSEGLAVKADITSLKDLVGKKIATPLGTSGEVMLRGAIKTYNLPADRITIVNLDPSAMAAAWERNDIQGVYIWDSWFSRLADMGGRKLLTDGQIVKDSGGKYNAGWDVYLTRNEFAEKNPDILRAFIRATDRGARFIRSNPEQAAKAIYQLFGVGSAEEMLELLKGDTFPTAEESRSAKWMGAPGKPGALTDAVMSIWEVMHDSGKIRVPPQREKVIPMIDPSFLQ